MQISQKKELRSRLTEYSKRVEVRNSVIFKKVRSKQFLRNCFLLSYLFSDAARPEQL